MAKANADSEQHDKSRFPTIERAELAGGYFSKHVTFIIRTPTNKKISRRYSDFEWLRSWLKVTFPGAFIPPIPPKLPVAAWPSGYLLMRKRELQQFLHRCEIIPYLQSDETVKYFLQYHKNSDDFEKARKEWDKSHKRPSFRATYDKLKATFPEIDELKTPDDMNERIQESRVLMEATIKELDRMIHSANNFVKHSEELQVSFEDITKCLQDLTEIERKGAEEIGGSTMTEAERKDEKKRSKILSGDYCKEQRVDPLSAMKQWETFNKTQATLMEGFIDPVLRRSIFDCKVIRDVLNTRDKLIHEYEQAQAVAQRWKTNYSQENLRASQIAAKHRDMQREEDLQLLTTMINKLSLAQLNLVFSANIRRWHKAQNNVIDQHKLALEKVLGSWRTLINKIIESSKGKDGSVDPTMSQVYKALVVEDLEEKENSKAAAPDASQSSSNALKSAPSGAKAFNDKNIFDNNDDEDTAPQEATQESNEKDASDAVDSNDAKNDMNKNGANEIFEDSGKTAVEDELFAEDGETLATTGKTAEERQEETMKQVNDLFGDDEDSADAAARPKKAQKVEKGLFDDDDDATDANEDALFGDAGDKEDVVETKLKSNDADNANEANDANDSGDAVETQETQEKEKTEEANENAADAQNEVDTEAEVEQNGADDVEDNTDANERNDGNDADDANDENEEDAQEKDVKDANDLNEADEEANGQEKDLDDADEEEEEDDDGEDRDDATGAEEQIDAPKIDLETGDDDFD